jgi:hypothetical protein
MLDPEALAVMMADVITEQVEKAVAPLKAKIAELEKREPVAGPPGEKGDKGDAGEAGRDGADGQNGSDGRGVKDLLIDRDGQLIATMDDGEMKTLGPIIGKDGEPGKDGRDGFKLEDFDVRVLDDDRTVELAFKSETHEHIATLKWPTVIDRGVYKAGETYQAGDGVTWGGSFWIAQKETAAKPDTAESGFRLAVKRGRDGKDAKVG